MGANVDTARREDERLGWLGNLGQPSQEDVRATVDTLCQSHAQRLAALVASSDDAILSLDLDGTIATWNRGVQDFFGYAADEVIGKSILSLLPTERQAEEPNILAHVGRGEHVQHYETVRLCKDGRRVAVSLSVSPIMDAGGTIIGASKIARDITAHKLTEEALAKRAAEQIALYQFTDRLFRARSVNDVYKAARGCTLARMVLECPGSVHSLFG